MDDRCVDHLLEKGASSPDRRIRFRSGYGGEGGGEEEEGGGGGEVGRVGRSGRGAVRHERVVEWLDKNTFMRGRSLKNRSSDIRRTASSRDCMRSPFVVPLLASARWS